MKAERYTETNQKVARNMLAKGYSIAEVIGMTSLSREQVRALKRA
jgi:hypothetical protein